MNTSKPEFREFDWIVVNTSGGKDSQTAMREVVDEAHRQQFDATGKIVAVHADLGEAEWDGTGELARQQADHYGFEFHVVRRRNAAGREESLLEYVRRRGKWPSSQQRYCTSDFKRGPCRRVLTELAKRTRRWRSVRQVRILNVFGFRAEESPARKKKIPFVLNESASTKLLASGQRSLEVWDWLPIHHWAESAVWQSIRESGVPYHTAYDLGMPRLSCRLCIFAPRAALIIAGKANPELLDKYVAVEREIGHDFQHGKPIAAIKAAIEAGEVPAEMSGAWNM